MDSNFCDRHMDKLLRLRHSAPMKTLRACLLALVLASSSHNVLSFNGHQITEGPLTVRIAEIPTVTNHAPQEVFIRLSNSAPADLNVQLQLTGLVDECRAVGETTRKLAIPGGGANEATFQFVAGEGAHSALYPIHIQATFNDEGRRRVARAIQIFETDFRALESRAQAKGEARVISVPSRGTLALANSSHGAVVWRVLKTNQTHRSASDWQGTDEKTGTSFFSGPVARGEARQALHMHPPYRTGAGTVFAEYRLRLPQTKPISLEFFNAIRDHSASEPPSDGVTFRVWVGEQSIFERHTASKTWVAGQASLDPWAGQEILLRLEGHPGPKSDTTCDSGFWGDPTIRSGEAPPQLTPAERKALKERARKAVETRQGSDGITVFDLGENGAAAIAPGAMGIADAAIAFGKSNQVVIYDGVRISLFDQVVGGGAGLQVEKVSSNAGAGRELHLVHSVALPEGPMEVTARAWKEGDGLRLRIFSPARITDLTMGPTDVPAHNVYYGHGYCIAGPGSFRAGGGGHNLATSHVGFDFANGISVLMACDTPPDDLQVDPRAGIYSLHTHPDSTFTFVPGNQGAMNCAVRYRELFDKKAAPALGKKAGRFVFDLWGGRYAEDTLQLQRCFEYGLTNSLVLMHVWQRWGYDYRLPDIYPPLPTLGTLEDLQNLGKTCDRAGVLWGLHDNYIDIYPDATDFSYENVTFDRKGEPRKAWLNEGRNAQSYQFRPDRVRPFLERNLGLIAPALRPSASFVDVWTSINAFDYYDRQGSFHSKMETLRCWGEDFARIRNAFGGGPTTSEAGSDQLIGWLDGADCQFLQIGEGRFNNRVPCRDWARVPWFDAVNHTRFSLHGVGYSDRYQGGRSREEHGIESDDYLSAELLTGHALMMDLPGLTRGAVRKYWLAQDFNESVALSEIQGVDVFGSDGDPLTAAVPGARSEAPHRLRVRWDNGAEVWVNRATNDWHVAGRVLPPFGFFARNGTLEASVERIGGVVAEQSRGWGRFYVNGRGFNPNAPWAIRPEAREIQHLGGRDFRLLVDWRAAQSAPKDLAVFYHFARSVPGRYTDVEFVGGGNPSTPTSKWQGQIVTGTNWVVHIPERMPLGEYDVLVGLYDAKGDGKRYRLTGEETDGRRYRVGKLSVEGSVSGGTTNITRLQLKRNMSPALTGGFERPLNQPVRFSVAETRDGLRLLTDAGGVTAVPLPDGETFETRLNIGVLLGKGARVESVHAVDAKGVNRGEARYTVEAGYVRLGCEPGVFGYRITRGR